MTNYYSVKTGLLIISMEVGEAQGQSFVSETMYSDYKEVKGVKFPYRILTNAGPQKMDITVNKFEVNPKISKSMFVIEE